MTINYPDECATINNDIVSKICENSQTDPSERGTGGFTDYVIFLSITDPTSQHFGKHALQKTGYLNTAKRITY